MSRAANRSRDRCVVELVPAAARTLPLELALRRLRREADNYGRILVIAPAYAMSRSEHRRVKHRRVLARARREARNNELITMARGACARAPRRSDR
jgi:hypothetical protein